jgi:hypothetical protein
MTCPITVRLGVYALGAADAGERVLIESHLAACQACRVELARLAPLPGLLARVPVNLLRPDPPPPPNTRAWKPTTQARRWKGAAAIAAAAALGVAAGFWLGRPGTSQPRPANLTLSGVNPVTHVRATVTLTATSWGTSIVLSARGLPLNQACRLIVRSRAGGTEVAGVWNAWRAGPVSIPASAGWLPRDISSLQVATTRRTLVTFTAARPLA